MERTFNSEETRKSEAPSETTIPVIAEELEAGVRRVATGGVRVHKRVHEHEEVIDQPLKRERVDVRRLIKNEVVAGPLPVRQEGDTTIVPVVEEVLVVQRQWVLKEELHITKHRVEEREQQRVVLQREDAEVVRFDAEGRPTGPEPVINADEVTDARPIDDARQVNEGRLTSDVRQQPKVDEPDSLIEAIRGRKNKIIK